MEKARVSSIQMFMLLIGFLYGSTVILNSALGAKNDAWLAILLGGAGGALLMGVYVAIALLNSSRTLVEILRDRFGKSVGNAVSILYIWYFIHLASLVFRNFGEFIATVTFPETPMVVVVGIFAIILVYAVNSGVEVIGRLSELLVPVLPVVVLIICLSLITTHDFTAFLPMLENGMAPVLNAALSVLFMVALSLLLFFRDITVLGSDLMQQATFVPHLTALLIPGMNVEPLVDINLLIGGGVKISVCIYAAARALSQVAGIGDYRKLTTAITTFCVVLSIWVYENVLEMFNWAEKVWPYYSIPFQIVIPLLLLFLSLRKRNEPSNAGIES